MKARFLLLCFLAACITGDPDDDDFGHDEDADFIVEPDDGKADGVAAVFDQHSVVPDDLFLDDGEMTVSDIQAFFERSPYGTRSWLADYRGPSGKTAAQAVAAAADAEGIHPLMLLTRMQVETSLVSKTVRPTQHRIDRALGCGCPDNSPCSTAYKGFDKQMACGAATLRRWYDASVDGSGQWRRGVSRRTLDPRTITPRNHATASLYAYTPWVLVNRGGNWLVWNVTRKYVRHAIAKGLLPEA